MREWEEEGNGKEEGRRRRRKEGIGDEELRGRKRSEERGREGKNGGGERAGGRGRIRRREELENTRKGVEKNAMHFTIYNQILLNI